MTAPIEEERDFLLRSLRDLEAEHDAGDIDDVDYQALKEDYTTRAAGVLRELAAPSDPSEKVAVRSGGRSTSHATSSAPQNEAAPRRWRRSAVIGAAALALGGLAGWAVVHATSHRSAGEVVSGDAIGPAKVSGLLAKAQKEAAAGKGVDALKDCRAVLAIEPGQPQALAEEGWLLAQTQRPDLQTQGLADLSQALTTDPTDTTAHLYRGIVLIDLGRKAQAVPDLQWYLAHDPSPQIKDQVQKELAVAQGAPAGP